MRSEQVREQLTSIGLAAISTAASSRATSWTLRARRPSGRLFELTLHRCSGQIVEVRAAGARPLWPLCLQSAVRYDDRPYGYDRRGATAARTATADDPYGYGGPRRWWWYGDCIRASLDCITWDPGCKRQGLALPCARAPLASWLLSAPRACYKAATRGMRTRRRRAWNWSRWPRTRFPAVPSTGTFKSHDKIELALCALGRHARAARGHRVPVPGPRRIHREVFRGGRRPAPARLCGRHHGLARSGRLASGCSPIPGKGHVRSFADFDRDLAVFMKEIVLPDCQPPYIAMAHSMGGHILLRNAVVPSSWFSRMVLSAPMIDIAPETLVRPASDLRASTRKSWAASGLGSLYASGGSDEPIETGPFEGNPLTTDPERYARNRMIIEAAPALGLGSPTIGWLRAALRSIARLIGARLPVEGEGAAAAVRGRHGHDRLHDGHRGIRAEAEGGHARAAVRRLATRSCRRPTRCERTSGPPSMPTWAWTRPCLTLR